MRRTFTSKVFKSNTLPIQISLTLVKTYGCTTSAEIRPTHPPRLSWRSISTPGCAQRGRRLFWIGTRGCLTPPHSSVSDHPSTELLCWASLPWRCFTIPPTMQDPCCVQEVGNQASVIVNVLTTINQKLRDLTLVRRNSGCPTFPHCLIVKKMLWQWVRNSVNTLRTLFEVIDHAELWQCLLPNHPSLKTQEEPPVSFSVGYGLGGNNGNWRRG